MSSTAKELSLEAALTSPAPQADGQTHPKIPLIGPYLGLVKAEGVVYSVPTQQLRGLVPGSFKLPSLFGKSLLVVIGSDYVQYFAFGSGVQGPRYQEVGYGVMATWKDPTGKRHYGMYFLALYLNQQIPVDSGVIYYGFPKHLSEVDMKDDGRNISYAARSPQGVPQFQLQTKERRGLLSFLFGLMTNIGYKLWTLFMGAPQGFFIREGKIVWTEFTVDPSLFKTRALKFESASYPDLVAWGGITPGQVDKPMVSVLFNRATGTIGAPLTYGTPEAPIKLPVG